MSTFEPVHELAAKVSEPSHAATKGREAYPAGYV